MTTTERHAPTSTNAEPIVEIDGAFYLIANGQAELVPRWDVPAEVLAGPQPVPEETRCTDSGFSRRGEIDPHIIVRFWSELPRHCRLCPVCQVTRLSKDNGNGERLACMVLFEGHVDQDEAPLWSSRGREGQVRIMEKNWVENEMNFYGMDGPTWEFESCCYWD